MQLSIPPTLTCHQGMQFETTTSEMATEFPRSISQVILLNWQHIVLRIMMSILCQVCTYFTKSQITIFFTI